MLKNDPNIDDTGPGECIGRTRGWVRAIGLRQ